MEYKEPMIEHVSLRCSDSKKSRKFYERALEPLGYVCDMSYGDSFGFKDSSGRHDFWVTPGKTGTPTHLAFHGGSKKAIDAFHAAALKAGGKDNASRGRARTMPPMRRSCSIPTETTSRRSSGKKT